jgi:hypothetical protein
MAEKQTPVIAGLGGAAVVAALLSFGGTSSPPDAGSKTPNTAVSEASSGQIEMTSNQEGPWYAFCQEYATNEFDMGKDPQKERGISGHQVPEIADEGTVELTHNLKGGYQEKFSVRKHMVGDLRSCVPAKTTLRVLIAMVPDPNATQMPLEFDRDVEAIQAAAAARQFNYTRFWFPWRSSDWTPDKSADPEVEVRRRQEPGILCFRKNDHNGDSQERLFVLLVGETPTSGVNRIQFAHALYYRQQLRSEKDEHGKDQPDELSPPDRDFAGIVGPHFSSSFKAIQDVMTKSIYQAKAPIPTVNLISPDATGQEYLEEFRTFCGKQWPPCTLRTLSLSSWDITSAVVPYLNTLDYATPHIAQWSEDESAFGVRQFNDLKHQYGLTLQFPRNLSSARSLSDRESARVAESGSKYFSFSSASPATQLTSREPTDRDSPAAFGSEQEAELVARSLADSVREMRASRTRAVVINASNPLDRIYLLEYLHNELPDVRAVTTEADELELDRPNFVDLTGTLTITALPPLSGLTDPPPPANGEQDTADAVATKRMTTFKSSRQEGEFLAVESLLDTNQSPGAPAHPAPCYTMSVVTESGFRLLPYLPEGEKDGQPTFPCTMDVRRPHELSTSLTAFGNPAAPRSFLCFLGFLVFLNILHFRCIVGSWFFVDRWLSYPGKMIASREPTRLYLLFATNNQLALLNLLGAALGSASWVAIAKNSEYDRWLIFILNCVGPLAAVTLAFSAYLLFWYSMSIARKDVQMTTASWSQMPVAVIYLCTSAWMLYTLPALKQSNNIFLARITSLTDGLSPVVPITAIMLGYFLWGWVQLKRLAWTTSRKADLGGSDDPSRDFGYRVRVLSANLDALMPTKQGFLAVGLPFCALLAFLLWNSLNGFDGIGFRVWLAVWGVIMLLFTVMITCFHALSIWEDLQKLLEWLEITPMREDFKQLGDDGLLQIKIWELIKPERSFRVLSRTVETIKRLPDSQMRGTQTSSCSLCSARTSLTNNYSQGRSRR